MGIRDVSKAQRARLEKSLDKPVRLSSGQVVKTRDWLDDLRAKGATLKSYTEHQYGREDKVKSEIARMGRNVPWGNPSHPETVSFNAEKARLLASLDKTRTGVELPEPDRRFFELNKTELEYFQGPTMPPGTSEG